MLKGDKVVLRAMRKDDLERYAEFQNDVETALLGGSGAPSPVELARVEGRFEEHVRAARPDMAWFAIDAQGIGFIGQCLLHHFDETARKCELGITIGDRDYWGRGYGRDAVKLLLKYAFRLRNMERVWLSVSGTNERAIRAYRACGFTEEGRLRRHIWLDGAYDDLVYMGVLRDEWQKPKLSGEEPAGQF